MLQLCDEMVINYTIFANYSGRLDQSGYDMYRWTILQKYDLSTPALATLKLELTHQIIDNEFSNDFLAFFRTENDKQIFSKFIFVSMLILSGTSLFINIRHYLKLKKTFDSINEKYKGQGNSGFYSNKNEQEESEQRKQNKANIASRISRIQNQNKEWRLIKETKGIETNINKEIKNQLQEALSTGIR